MINQYVNLMHEVGMLAKTPRSGFAFLGSGRQSVAEHSFSMTWIGFILAELCQKVQPINRERLLLLCLVHDFVEARTGDLNYVNKRYVTADEEKASADIRKVYPCGNFLYDALKEYREGTSVEAKLAHDADQLELLLMLKEQMEQGNPRAIRWFENGRKRLQSDIAKEIAEVILQTPADSWWFANPDDPHWVNGGK